MLLRKAISKLKCETLMCASHRPSVIVQCVQTQNSMWDSKLSQPETKYDTLMCYPSLFYRNQFLVVGFGRVWIRKLVKEYGYFMWNFQIFLTQIFFIFVKVTYGDIPWFYAILKFRFHQQVIISNIKCKLYKLKLT